ncbi:MAG: hypothetical protein K9L78_00285 [Victivallales bacterium]|nr:hypothetical protein [Victivallales bacterium]MCF7888532.1 hypothetical protein [Victivallales bacterium]
MSNIKRKFTLIEILLIIGIIAILFSILIPAITNVKKQADIVNDINNLKQLSLGMVMYAELNDNYLPYTEELAGTDYKAKTLWLLLPYLSNNTDIFSPGNIEVGAKQIYSLIKNNPTDETVPAPGYAYSPYYDNGEREKPLSLLNVTEKIPVCATYAKAYGYYIVSTTTLGRSIKEKGRILNSKNIAYSELETEINQGVVGSHILENNTKLLKEVYKNELIPSGPYSRPALFDSTGSYTFGDPPTSKVEWIGNDAGYVRVTPNESGTFTFTQPEDAERTSWHTDRGETWTWETDGTTYDFKIDDRGRASVSIDGETKWWSHSDSEADDFEELPDAAKEYFNFN